MGPQLRTAVNRPYVPRDGTTITAEVDVDPGTQADPVERHIALCIDTSGSMTGEKIERAREGARWVFGLLEPEDYITVVGFNSTAEVLLEPTRWADIDREIAQARVDSLAAGGGTNMFDGLETARDALDSVEMRADAGEHRPVRRVLLLSDGKDKHHESAAFRDLAIDIDESGIRVEAAGIGEDYNQDTIRTIGTTARGEWTHLEGPGDIETFFGEAVERARSVVATNARLELDVADGVEISEVYRALPQSQAVDLDWRGNATVVPLPDLAERERQRVVMKIHVPESETSGPTRLVDVKLVSEGSESRETITVEYTDDTEKLARHDESVQLSHHETVVRTKLGEGDVDAAQTQVEKMTRIHGEETQVVEEVQEETRLVAEGGYSERNRVTKIVDDDGIQH